MIRTLRTVYLRAVCRTLNRRGLSLHAIADGASIGVEVLRRLMEFGSLPDDPETGERLVSLLVRLSSEPRLPQRYDAAKQRLTISLGEGATSHPSGP